MEVFLIALECFLNQLRPVIKVCTCSSECSCVDDRYF